MSKKKVEFAVDEEDAQPESDQEDQPNTKNEEDQDEEVDEHEDDEEEDEEDDDNNEEEEEEEGKNEDEDDNEEEEHEEEKKQELKSKTSKIHDELKCWIRRMQRHGEEQRYNKMNESFNEMEKVLKKYPKVYEPSKPAPPFFVKHLGLIFDKINEIKMDENQQLNELPKEEQNALSKCKKKF